MGDLDFDSLHTDFDLDPKGFDGLLAELADGGEIETGLRAKPKPTAGEETGAGHREAVTTRATRRQCYDLSASRKALEHILKLPEEDETLHCLMGGDYRAFDVLLAIHSRGGEPIRSLTVTTLGFNRQNLTHLCRMMAAGEVRDVQMLCSEYMENVDSDLYVYAREELAKVGGVLRAARNHSKILCIDFGARAFVVESSANLRSCNNLEQFTLTHSRELYDFHRGWIRSVIASRL
jgi:hypothetical protein